MPFEQCTCCKVFSLNLSQQIPLNLCPILKLNVLFSAVAINNPSSAFKVCHSHIALGNRVLMSLKNPTINLGLSQLPVLFMLHGNQAVPLLWFVSGSFLVLLGSLLHLLLLLLLFLLLLLLLRVLPPLLPCLRKHGRGLPLGTVQLLYLRNDQ